MEIRIRKCLNGYVCEMYEYNPEASKDDLPDQYVVVETHEGDVYDNTGNSLSALERVFWETREFFGIYPSDSDDYNLCVRIEDRDGREVLSDSVGY